MSRNSRGMRGRNGIGRREFVKQAALGAAAVATASGAGVGTVFAQAKKKVSFTLPWLANGESLFAFVALEKGMWAKRGLDVDVTRGFGSVGAAQSIAQGKFDFGFAAAPAGILQAAKGLKMVMLGCCTYNPTMGVGVLQDSPIKTPKDLEGKKMGCVVSSGEYPFLPAFAERAGFDLSTVTIVQVDNKIRESALIAGQVDAISGFASGSVASLVSKGHPARYFLYNDFGMPFYGQMLMTQPERLAADPGLCEAITEGAMEAIHWTMMNPEEGLNIFYKRVKESALTKASRERIRIGLGIFTMVNLTETAKTKGVGYSDPAAFVEMTDLIMKHVAKPEDKRPDLDALLTNKFVEGKYRYSDAEWASMKAYAKDFAGYLS